MTLFWYYRPEQLKCSKKKQLSANSFNSASSKSANASSAATSTSENVDSPPPPFSSSFSSSSPTKEDAAADEANHRCRILSSTRVLKSSLRLNHRPSEATSVDDITKSKVAEFNNSNEVFATKHLDYNSVACIEGNFVQQLQRDDAQ